MRLSLNFVKDYVDIDENIDVKELAEKMTAIGNEYDEATSLVNATNLVVGEVLTCQMHPDSDHLHLCEVNIGEEVLNIVCGAPNVRTGLKVIVAKVGAELPGGVKIKKGLIRGQESNGMLCSLYEIGIDKKYLSEQDKNGICELPSNAKPGDDPIKVLGLDDKIIDFELTANRGDLLSILGTFIISILKLLHNITNFPHFISKLPLYNVNLEWLMFAIIFGIVGMFVKNKEK